MKLGSVLYFVLPAKALRHSASNGSYFFRLQRHITALPSAAFLPRPFERAVNRDDFSIKRPATNLCKTLAISV